MLFSQKTPQNKKFDSTLEKLHAPIIKLTQNIATPEPGNWIWKHRDEKSANSFTQLAFYQVFKNFQYLSSLSAEATPCRCAVLRIWANFISQKRYHFVNDSKTPTVVINMQKIFQSRVDIVRSGISRKMKTLSGIFVLTAQRFSCSNSPIKWYYSYFHLPNNYLPKLFIVIVIFTSQRLITI